MPWAKRGVFVLQTVELAILDWMQNTLRCEALDTIVPISARLIANKAGYQFKNEKIDMLVRQLAAQLENQLAQQKKRIEMINPDTAEIEAFHEAFEGDENGVS